MRRRLAILAVVALVALAGCSAITPDDASGGDGIRDGGADGNDTPESTDVRATVETVDYPTGYDESGVVDSAAAVRAHDEAVQSAEGFRFAADVTITVPNRSGDGPDERMAFDLETVVDNEAGTEYSRAEFDGNATETYRTSDGVLYTRNEVGGDVWYRQESSGSVSEFTLSDFEAAIASVDLEPRSVETDGSTTLITYAGDEIDDPNGEFGNVDNASVELVVDTKGRIHEFAVESSAADGPDLDVSFAFEFESVTVEEPAWLDEAKEQTG